MLPDLPPDEYEAKRLQLARERIQEAYHQTGHRLREQYLDFVKAKQYFQDNKSGMDHVEKVSVRGDLHQMGRIGEHSSGRHTRLGRLLDSPYFGRFDFRRGGSEAAEEVYVGVHAFYDSETDTHWVHDWRAPVSSLFYDFEMGPAFFSSPDGDVKGEVTLKRQFRIEEGKLVFFFDSELAIRDTILQDTLGRASGEKMKNIVATLQRDQNSIIRDEETHSLVLQGAAGSGKTSIALHRIAFLLYRYRDEIEANDILILSPNKVFAHYISNVLPELGEEMIKETTVEILADHLLGFKVKFESFAEQVARLLEKEDQAHEERIRFKARPEMVEQLEEYAREVLRTQIVPGDVTVELPMRTHTVPAEVLREHLLRQARMPFAARITDAVNAVGLHLYRATQKELDAKQRAAARKQISAMFRSSNLKKLYKDFYTWAEVPKLYKPAKGAVLEHADVFPVIYLSMLLEGFKAHAAVKHLVIDEMQDYTPVHYQVFAKLFPCRKTILGDRFQSVNPWSSSTAELISAVLPDAHSVAMHKSYRSTLEISRFAQHIQPNPLLEPLERHGEPPLVSGFDSCDEEVVAIEQEIRAFRESGQASMGVLCKTQEQANAMFYDLDALNLNVHLLDPSSTHFEHGVLIVTAHLAKGLEFDRVLIPDCTDERYCREIDRHMLYVACTRAMHRLRITHTGKPSRFLPGN